MHTFKTLLNVDYFKVVALTILYDYGSPLFRSLVGVEKITAVQYKYVYLNFACVCTFVTSAPEESVQN
jgi:hypothetical protein